MQRSTLKFLATSLLTGFLGVGCGGGRGPQLGSVTGTITLNGEPLPGVSVTFIPEDQGSPSYGGTDKNGVYRLQFNQARAGAELGTHHVIIEVPEPATDDSGKRIDSTPIVKIPNKYRQPGTLTADVSSGKNIVDFDLEAYSKPGSVQNESDSKRDSAATRTAGK